MIILKEKIDKQKLINIENETFFEDMIKCVVDIDKGIVAVNAEFHSDLEDMLIRCGSQQNSLYGINILFDEWEIEYDSMINPPRNREAGFPRAGRYVADPIARERIEEIVKRWIEI